MVLGKPKPAHTSIIVPRLLPKPRCLRPTAAASPWIAIDPVLRADCVSFCRSIQLAFVAFLALMAGTRSAFAAPPAAPADRFTNARQSQFGSETEESASIGWEQASVPAQKQERRSFSNAVLARGRAYLDPLIPKVPQLNLERAHAPPVAELAFLTVGTLLRLTAPPPVGLSFASSLSRSSLPFRSTFDILAFRCTAVSHCARSGYPTVREGMRAAAPLRSYPNSDPGGITHVCC